MAEPEWWAEARRLRAEGLSQRAIGQRLGKSQPGVQYVFNPEKIRERKRAWFEANREKERERKRAWFEANREKVLERERVRRESLKEQGLCSKCRVREADFGLTQCIRCQEYDAERQFLGYSNIKVGKESGWFDGNSV